MTNPGKALASMWVISENNPTAVGLVNLWMKLKGKLHFLPKTIKGSLYDLALGFLSLKSFCHLGLRSWFTRSGSSWD
jgi:hypothetical protein